MLSDTQKEDIRQFADRITPKSWHVILDPRDERLEAGVLNIHINIEGPENEVYTDFFGRKCYPYEAGDGTLWYENKYGNLFHRNQIKPVLGMIYGRMVFKTIKSHGIHRKGKVARIVIRLWPYLDDWKITLVHELAHVAVYRYHACRTKDYTKKALFRNPWDMDLKSMLIKKNILREGHHGSSFQKAFFTLTQRVVREFKTEISGNDFWESLKNEL